MNKKLLAAAILTTFAGAASASVNLHDNDGLTVDAFGDIKAQYSQDVGADKEAKLTFKDAKFGIDGRSVVNDDMSVFGQVKFKGDIGGDGDSVLTDKAFIGFDYGVITLSAGRQNNFADDFGASVDEAVGGDYKAREQAGAIITDKTNQVIQVTFDNDTIFGGVDYTGASDGSESDADLVQYGVMVGWKMEAFDVAIYHVGAEKADVEQSSQQIEANYALGSWKFNAAVSQSEVDSVDANSIAVTALYTMDKTTFGAGWSTLDQDNADEVSQWHLNAIYDLSANANMYAEVAGNDEENQDIGYAVGMKLSF